MPPPDAHCQALTGSRCGWLWFASSGIRKLHQKTGKTHEMGGGRMTTQKKACIMSSSESCPVHPRRATAAACQLARNTF